MSTKAIREVLGEAGFKAPDTCDESMARKVAAAWAEVEAIERAAFNVVLEKALEDWNTAQPVALREGIKVLQAIAGQD